MRKKRGYLIDPWDPTLPMNESKGKGAYGLPGPAAELRKQESDGAGQEPKAEKPEEASQEGGGDA